MSFFEAEEHFLKTHWVFLYLNCLNYRDTLVNRNSKKTQNNHSSYNDSLAQPLKLRESLMIRDGLHNAFPARWAQFKAIRLPISVLGPLWVCNN
jgi:hypothetical protein